MSAHYEKGHEVHPICTPWDGDRVGRGGKERKVAREKKEGRRKGKVRKSLARPNFGKAKVQTD